MHNGSVPVVVLGYSGAAREGSVSDLPGVPRVTLGRSGIESTRLGVGCAVWPKKRSYDEVVEFFGIIYIFNPVDKAKLGTDQSSEEESDDAEGDAEVAARGVSRG